MRVLSKLAFGIAGSCTGLVGVSASIAVPNSNVPDFGFPRCFGSVQGAGGEGVVRWWDEVWEQQSSQGSSLQRQGDAVMRPLFKVGDATA